MGWTISVAWFRPDLELFLEDKVKYENSRNPEIFLFQTNSQIKKLLSFWILTPKIWFSVTKVTLESQLFLCLLVHLTESITLKQLKINLSIFPPPSQHLWSVVTFVGEGGADVGSVDGGG